MKVVLCWIEMTGYMAACWRELARQPGLELLVLATRSGTRNPNAPFDDRTVDGVPCRLLDRNRLNDCQGIAELVLRFSPDAVYLSGWDVPAYVRLAFHPGLAGVRFVLGLDTPREDTWRQRLARWRVGGYVDRMDRVVVPGERGWQFARRWLKVPEWKLRRGLYGVDYDAFARALEERRAGPGGWPRKLLFAGRYERAKGLDVLLEAYQLYRRRVRGSWPLTCCGKGSLAGAVSGADSVEDRGFVQPGRLPAIMARHGVFVLPSRREPWGAVIAEAGAAGLPIVCTESCSAAVEIVRPYYNGLIVPTEDPAALADGLLWMHHHADQLHPMGQRSQQLAAPYSAQMWSACWMNMFGELVGSQPAAA